MLEQKLDGATQDLIQALSEVSDIETIAAAARKARAERLKSKVPADKLEKLKVLHNLVKAGDDASIHFLLPLSIKVNIGTEGSNWEYGHVRDWSVNLGDGASNVAKKFFERYMEGAKEYIREDSSSLETLSENSLAPVLDRQTKLFADFDALRREIEDTYEIDVWPLIEEKE